jgi:membrane fusion protein, multidrug efflux system
MNPIVFAMRRPVTTMTLIGVLISGGVLASNKALLDTLRPLNTPKIQIYLDYVGTHANELKEYVVGKFESYFHKEEEAEAHHESRTVVVTSPTTKDVTLSHPYVCLIRSQRHIEVCSLENGYLKEIAVKEGQAVKQGDVLFRILPILFKSKFDAESAKAKLAQLKFDYTKKLADDKVVSQQEVALLAAELAEANAKASLAKAELGFADVIAPFDGIVDRQREQLGSLIKEGDVLTTLSDNSVMWVYFNVPEADYLEYMESTKQNKDDQRIELELANHHRFQQPGNISTIEAKFNPETGNLAFRADFPNPPVVAGDPRTRLLRHGQTGTVWIMRTLKNAVVIPQRATFELLDKRYVWVLDKDDKAHQTLITIKHELEDIFVINSGIAVGDKIVLEGVREVEEGQKVEFEFREPEEALKNQKFRAE